MTKKKTRTALLVMLALFLCACGPIQCGASITGDVNQHATVNTDPVLVVICVILLILCTLLGLIFGGGQ